MNSPHRQDHSRASDCLHANLLQSGPCPVGVCYLSNAAIQPPASLPVVPEWTVGQHDTPIDLPLGTVSKTELQRECTDA